MIIKCFIGWKLSLCYLYWWDNRQEAREGDSPLVGSGGYADNESGAVSTTGHGESITKVCLAYRVVQSLESVEVQRRRQVKG